MKPHYYLDLITNQGCMLILLLVLNFSKQLYVRKYFSITSALAPDASSDKKRPVIFFQGESIRIHVALPLTFQVYQSYNVQKGTISVTQTRSISVV